VVSIYTGAFGVKEGQTVVSIYTGRFVVSRDSSVGIATGSGLDDPGIESRWGVRFSVPV
jgi:hypothetical protein